MADIEIVYDDAALTELLESETGPVAKDLLRRAVNVHRQVEILVHQPGAGRTYQLYNPRRTHVASAPGQPPAADTGKYAASIVFDLERDAQGLVAKVGTNDKRGIWLELGTRRMAPRPHFRVALPEAAK